MFLILLKFSDDKAGAGQHLDGHNAWLRRGFDDGVFLLAGGLQRQAGGGILAHNTTLEALRTRIAADPFVSEGVVRAEIVEITPARADDRLAFLVPGRAAAEQPA